MATGFSSGQMAEYTKESIKMIENMEKECSKVQVGSRKKVSGRMESKFAFYKLYLSIIEIILFPQMAD